MGFMNSYKSYILSKYLILYTVYLLTVTMLIIFSGELIEVLTDPVVRSKDFFLGLCLYDTTLVVPRYDDFSVLFYDILTE
mgnify:CR=1 FL=1